MLKQIHHEPCDYYQFGDKIQSEVNDYKRLKDIGIRLPELIEVDVQNERILKEYINGDTIYDLVKNDKMKREYLDQITDMCSLVRSCGHEYRLFSNELCDSRREVVLYRL